MGMGVAAVKASHSRRVMWLLLSEDIPSAIVSQFCSPFLTWVQRTEGGDIGNLTP
jgi:hypothetical protein